MSRPPIFALIDCNNFFVSCERLFRPALKAVPVAVLSNNDGCVIARSNEVKALGVAMGAPLFKHRELLAAHGTHIFSANFPLYGDISDRVATVLAGYSPNVEVYSIDESFLQVDGLSITDYDSWAKELARIVEKQVGIPVSVGVGPTKTLAKAAVEYVKKHPDNRGGLSLVDDLLAQSKILAWLEVGDVWGIGRRTAEKLHRVGIKNASGVVGLRDSWVLDNLTITGLRTIRELRGESCIPLDLFESKNQQKNLSVTRSFGGVVRSYSELESAIATFSARAAMRLRRKEQMAWRGSVFMRARLPDKRKQFIYTNFSLDIPTSFTADIIKASLGALESIYEPDFRYDKAGVILHDLIDEGSQQMSLFAEKNQDAKLTAQLHLMKAMDTLSLRYGKQSVTFAAEGLANARWRSRQEKVGPAYTTRWSDIPKVNIA
jgi:DNA polymerase V